MVIFEKPDRPATGCQKFRYFFSSHWRGVQLILTPIIFSFILLVKYPPEGWQWCAYTLVVMASYWVTECAPLPVTAFLPIVVFPLTDIMDCVTVCKCYINDTVIVFLGSLMLASAVEQSGLHIRVALCAIKLIGYSHYKLLFSMGMVTMFVSWWLTNTAATTMFVPINFALLKVFEDQGLLKIYEYQDDQKVAGRFTVAYFCMASYSATIGGIGTLIGTATNLVFKGLMDNAVGAPEYITFLKFSMWSVPYVILMQLYMYFCMVIVYLGFMRPKSILAKEAKISPEGVQAAKAVVNKQYKDLGNLTFWECMVLTLFGLAIVLFFSRSPQMFPGWGDAIADFYGIDKKSIKDSANTLSVIFLMLLVPSTMGIFKNCSAKYKEKMPKGPIPSVIKFVKMDNALPYSFMFLLGGGFALSKCATPKFTDLNGKIGNLLAKLQVLPNFVIVLIMIVITVFLTNFASNVAVANVVVPIGMALAENIGKNPLLYNIACGVSASYCFMLPVGTPGNLVIQSAASITTSQMIKCGALPTIGIIFITWIAVMLWGPVIWPDIAKNRADLAW